MHLSLEELKMSLESSLRAQSVCHTLSPRVESESDFGLRVGVQVFSAGVGFWTVWSPKFSNPGVGVEVPQKKTRTPHP